MLLLAIYFAFISLGLPDAMLGSAWPVMQPELGARYASAGWIFMIVSAGTIVSSITSAHVLRRFGVGRVAVASVALTAMALFMFAFAPSYAWLPFAAVPLGLGAGAIDAGLNAFVAERYESRHMSWLHAFWGVGAMCGPLLLAAVLARGASWRLGYLLAASVQAALAAALLRAHPLWGESGRGTRPEPAGAGSTPSIDHRKWFLPLRAPGVKTALLSFFCYCGIEASLGLWGASFLSKARGLSPGTAASWLSGCYAGLTAGRFLTGFLTYRVSNGNLIRSGCLAILAGAILTAFPLPLPLAGFLMIGLGCAPIFPCLLQETPNRFASADPRAIMGFQMAAAYIGTTFLAPAFGFIAAATSFSLLPFFLLACIAVLAIGSESLRRM
jgi:fucose permease